MQIDIQARGFSLTAGIAAAVRREADALPALLGDCWGWLQVRLFDINSSRGGIDKGCLVSARLGGGRRVVVVTSLDADLYRAIPIAFDKLRRAALAQRGREQHRRRRASRDDTRTVS